jgi:hypothetical protein
MPETNYAFDFDNLTLTEDPQPFQTLPDGEYPFIVERFERGYHNGSAKMPPCPKAELYLRVSAADGRTVTVRDTLFLCEMFVWKLSQFFIAIGLKQPGVDYKPDWNAIVGCAGHCVVYTEEYQGEKYNRVKRYVQPVAGHASYAVHSPMAW